MKPRRLAVIDLGSNTFHLLIIETRDLLSWDQLYKERRYVKLASEGMDWLSDNSCRRAIDAMKAFRENLDEFQVDHVRAIGTSAMREASNGAALAHQIHQETNIKVEIIDGEQEAAYILAGIRFALPALDRPALIMDIGGGSVEFILFEGENIHFKASYRIGVTELFRRFHHSDPMRASEGQAMEAFLAEVLDSLFNHLKRFPDYDLIGASGSFEVIRGAMPLIMEEENWALVDMSNLRLHLDMVIGLSLDERYALKIIPNERVDFIVVAYSLIRQVITAAPPASLYYCDYALKEGVMAEMMNTIFR